MYATCGPHLFGGTAELGVVDFPYDGSFHGVSFFNCCNISLCDQQFMALQGNVNLAGVRLMVLEQDLSRKILSAHC